MASFLLIPLPNDSSQLREQANQAMTIPTAKALHIIGFTCWFSGLFYLVRLFVYNREARDQGNTTVASSLNVMQRRLFYGITIPVMLITLSFGVWLMALVTNQFSAIDRWLYFKLILVGLVVSYTLLCGRIHKQLVNDSCPWTSRGLRALNEAATVFLVFIVFIAVFKNSFTLETAAKTGFGIACVMVPGFALFGRRSPSHSARHKTLPPRSEGQEHPTSHEHPPSTAR